MIKNKKKAFPLEITVYVPIASLFYQYLRICTSVILEGLVGAPLMLGSFIHLYPDIFINILAFVPVLVWSMYLLYSGIHVVLHTAPERGMLMASSLIGYLLVAFVSLLGITVMLWSVGIGPILGI